MGDVVPFKNVGLIPVPEDTDIEKFLEQVCAENDKKLYEVLQDMHKTVEQTEDSGQPVIFAYAKLLNFLASNELSEPDKIRLLAAAIWELV